MKLRCRKQLLFESVQTLSVPLLTKPERLDVFLCSQLQLTRAKIQNLIKKAHIRVNDTIPEKGGIKVRGGERIEVSIPPPKESLLKKEAIPLDVIYEDESLLALNKPAGLVVHPAAGHWEGTLVNALLYQFQNLSGVDPARPGIVHRLDKDTSGILLIAKNDKAHLALSNQFKNREIEKRYAALVQGSVPLDQGIMEKPIGRHPQHRKKMAVVSGGRPAYTEFKVIQRWKDKTLLECKIKTGRTHQIRVHLASIGHPVIGDALYGKKDPDVPRQLLHAWKVKLLHPITGVLLQLEAPLPTDFEKFIT